MTGGTRSSSLQVVNDATAYGVAIAPAQVVQGETYWKCIRVHHLTPEENKGNHHIFIDVVDESDQRVYGSRVSIKWPSGSGIGTIDKPPNEPGTNFPVWKNQVVEIEVIGRPSDRVTNVHTGHPDEGSGNTNYHHSFYIVFKRAIYDEAGQANRGVIEGTVTSGAGRTIALELSGQQIATTIVGQDERYRFEHLVPGAYRVVVQGTDVAADAVSDGKGTIVVNLAVTDGGSETGPVLTQYVLFGSPDAPGTRANVVLAQDYVLRTQSASGFRVEEALRAARVTIVGDVRGVSQADEERLVKAGIEVRRVAGDSYTVESELAGLS